LFAIIFAFPIPKNMKSAAPLHSPLWLVPKLAALLGLSSITLAAVVPVTGVTGHDGGNWAPTLGHLTDMINGADPSASGTLDPNPGMTLVNPSDPSTWTYSGSNWQQEWKANSRLNPATSSNAKIGWTTCDLGSLTTNLHNLYLWNVRSQNTTENVATYNVYYSSSPTVALPAMPNSKSIAGDYDFAGGGWTLLNTGGALSLPVNTTNNNTPQAVVPLGNISARYIGIEILTAGGAASRVGLAQVEFTQTVADNDPPTLLGTDIVDDKGGGPVDVNTVVTYTVTFSEDMNAGTVSSDDFSNAGTSAISIGAITETSPRAFSPWKSRRPRSARCGCNADHRLDRRSRRQFRSSTTRPSSTTPRSPSPRTAPRPRWPRRHRR
jgi:hypothetical protein